MRGHLLLRTSVVDDHIADGGDAMSVQRGNALLQVAAVSIARCQAVVVLWHTTETVIEFVCDAVQSWCKFSGMIYAPYGTRGLKHMHSCDLRET